MQIDRIIEKARQLGINIDANLSNEEIINYIANELGLDPELSSLDDIENRLYEVGKTDNIDNIEYNHGSKWHNNSENNPVYFKNENRRLERIASNFKNIEQKHAIPEVNEETPNVQIKNMVKTEAKKEIEKKAGQAILSFIKKNPYVLAIIGVIAIVLLLLLLVTTAYADNKIGYYDLNCDYNNVNITLSTCTSSETISLTLEEYTIRETYNHLGNLDYNENFIKALMLIIKTNALSMGGYTPGNNRLTLDYCIDVELDSTDDDYITLKNYYNDLYEYTMINANYNGITSLGEEDVIELNYYDFLSNYNDELYEEFLNSYYGEEKYQLYNFTTNCTKYDIVADDSAWWWPIGSSTATQENIYGGSPISSKSTSYPDGISSYFGSRVQPTSGASTNHGAIDIPVGTGTPIIATKSGTVISLNNSYKMGTGTKLGNSVFIDHGEGIVSLYGHLLSVEVNVGEYVSQGQLIGYSDNTGTSTGPHLHFGIIVNGVAVDPLNYVNIDNPRPVALDNEFDDSYGTNSGTYVGSNLTRLIKYFEGAQPSSSGYVVTCIGDGVATGPHGVTLDHNAEVYRKYGYNIESPYLQYCGNLVISQRDSESIFNDVIESKFANPTKERLNEGGITLTDYQFNALISLEYTTGVDSSFNSFVNALNNYGSGQNLCIWWNNYAVKSGTVFENGLRNRRKRECNLFVTGQYPN